MLNDKVKKETLYHTALLLHKLEGKRKPVSISRAGNKKLRELLYAYESVEEVFRHFYPRTMFRDPLNSVKGIEQVVKSIEKVSFDYQMVTCLDDNYPEKLHEHLDSPPILYARGDFRLVNFDSFAVVGSRNLHDRQDKLEGKLIMERLLNSEKSLKKTGGYGYCIVSGLASGCDTLAHKYAINNGKKTVAVIGTALDKSYPAINRELQEKIAQEQLLLTQYPIGFRPFKGTGFVNRNYTVACLANKGAIIIKAGDKSGTQHVIRHCLEQGKKVYALNNNYNGLNRWVGEEGVKRI